MKTIEHSLRFITEVDETNPTGATLLMLDESEQVLLLESMLKDLLLPAIVPAIEELNKGGSWAILKAVQ